MKHNVPLYLVVLALLSFLPATALSAEEEAAQAVEGAAKNLLPLSYTLSFEPATKEKEAQFVATLKNVSERKLRVMVDHENFQGFIQVRDEQWNLLWEALEPRYYNLLATGIWGDPTSTLQAGEEIVWQVPLSSLIIIKDADGYIPEKEALSLDQLSGQKVRSKMNRLRYVPSEELEALERGEVESVSFQNQAMTSPDIEIPTKEQLEALVFLQRVQQMETYEGNLFGLALTFKIPYRPILEQAIAKNPAGLHALLRMKTDLAYTETHAQVLSQMLVYWGDKEFAKALSGQSKEVQWRIFSQINDIWASKEWLQYPEMMQLSKKLKEFKLRIPDRDPKRWNHVETGTAMISLNDFELDELQELYGKTTSKIYGEGSQIAYLDELANAAVVFADGHGSEIRICRPRRLSLEARKVDLQDAHFLSSRRILLGDSREQVEKILGIADEVSTEDELVKLWYSATGADGEHAPCSLIYDGFYFFEEDKLVEMRFWDGS